ncbi:hypothetical protein FHR83_005005 [Actinoplanes campanulatus]|uniref:Uncharacterized protein n=1 Tax=Actinoplanes campanulatus TaxID=113559 RepID=A0A7W5FGF0_9ACTN|nr:hypothetical protein [Actinoplanes campanulatus]MBB3097330.1 hypothetical protein [Actinoplanes campanulatus]GGN17285.1 hypothetical protein GCM10010109_29890 [Actinoplanes campanulatus]GID37487.1 hypothetical protein Aca09nite_39930 [Actinoplanes campanulatus]
MRVDLISRRPVRRLMAAGAAVACVWAAAGSRSDASTIGVADRGIYVFSVNGTSMEGLHPGAVRRTRVTVTNPYPFRIAVRHVEARVAGSSRRHCKPTATNLAVGSYLGSLPLTVPAHGRKAAGKFEVRMPNTVADACQKATFRLTFTATADRVGR